MAVGKIDREDLFYNIIGPIKTAVLCDTPNNFIHVAVGLNGYNVFVPEDVVGSKPRILRGNGIKSMIAAVVEPITRYAVRAEPRSDHARTAVLPQVTKVFMEYPFEVGPNSTWLFKIGRSYGSGLSELNVH